MQHNISKGKLIGTILLSIIVLFAEIGLIVSISVTQSITASSISQIWFGTNPSTVEYNWLGSESVDDSLLIDGWQNGLSDIDIEHYSASSLLINLGAEMSETIGAHTADSADNTIYDVLTQGEMPIYANEFVLKQTGYLIGDNQKPIPAKTELAHIVSDTMTKYASEETLLWYKENKASVDESIYAYLLKSTDVLYESLVVDDSLFAESCTTVRILNLSMVTYVLIAVIAILTFVIFLIKCNKLFFGSVCATSLLSGTLAFAMWASNAEMNLMILGSRLPFITADTNGVVAIIAIIFLSIAFVFSCFLANELLDIVSKVKHFVARKKGGKDA